MHGLLNVKIHETHSEQNYTNFQFVLTIYGGGEI